jgi:ATP-binding cassette subfamily C protein/ATP-binding cassette subfamily C protein CydC
MLRALLSYWPRLLATGLAATAAELSGVALLATAAWLIARAAEAPTIAALSVAIAAVRALALGRGVLRYTERLVGHNAALGAVAGLRARVYRALVPLAPAGIPAFRSGELLTRLVDDVDAAQDLVLRCIVPATIAAGAGVAATGLATMLLPAAGAVLAAGLLVAGVAVPLVVFARARPGPGTGALAAQAVDLHAGAAELAAFGATAAALERARRSTDEIARRERTAARTAGAATATVLAVQGATTACVALLASDRLPTVPAVVLGVLSLAVFDVLAPLPEAAQRLAAVRASTRRLAAVLSAAPPVIEPPTPITPPVEPGALVLSGVRARHRPGAPPALDGVDLRVDPGRLVAVVGASGAGKSTLLAVLMRFVEYEGGATLGGVELRAMAGDDVRRLITGVTQDAHVFQTTVRANLTLAKPDATDAELRAVAARVRLLDWIEAQPDGWSTELGTDGAGLSGAERLRLLLGRALLADPPVLVLDEPTEGLDPETAATVLTDLLGATRGRTTLLVTHDPAVVVRADEVVELANGRPVEPAPA